ncbi:hypothetical protein [Streptomyces sp. NRRL F-5126]|uniref:hypothetical protein n=1 Tax=Streptomyces sp. NRRL F-5126 TaxID=1463857 RepID=UPI0004CC758D|nr:hypothetical protein [Streptomyces sp. NRRL F-5126]
MAAAVLGSVGLATSIVSVGGLLGLLGLVLGLVALRTARRTGVGRGQAITGAVLSAAAILVSAAVAIAAVWFAHRTQSCYHLNHVHQWSQCVHRQFGRH